MKSEFLLAFNQICSERNLSKEVVLEALQTPLVSAYRRNINASSAQNVTAQIDGNTGMAKATEPRGSEVAAVAVPAGRPCPVTYDAVRGWRRVPALRLVGDYHDDPGYVQALARSVRELWEREGEPERLLLSFHGIPVRYARAGDPYPRQCQRTANLLAEALQPPYERWFTSFQSRFGRAEWLTPYTDMTVKRLAEEGVKNIAVVTPGFVDGHTHFALWALNRRRVELAGAAASARAAASGSGNQGPSIRISRRPKRLSTAS